MKDNGLYYYAESSRYPIYEGIKYKRKADIEELKKILKDANMPFLEIPIYNKFILRITCG